MDCVFDASQAPILDIVAGFIGAFKHRETLAAILEHLRYERHPIKTSVLVESGKNLFAASHLN